jgi:drug/metabolite transporter (DMT)-like permease
MGKDNAGIVLVLVSAISFGLMPIFARLAYSQGVEVDELLFVRFMLAFFIMGGILASRGYLTVPRRNDLLVLIGLGAVAYFLQSTLYFTSLLYSPVAIVELLLYTYPVLVAVGAFTLGWERISRRLMAAIIIAIVGLIFVANPIGYGAILAIGSSVTYTI